MALLDNLEPLTKGTVQFLSQPDVKVKYVSREDVGKAVGTMFRQGPEQWHGKTLEAASCALTGDQLAEALFAKAKEAHVARYANLRPLALGDGAAAVERR